MLSCKYFFVAVVVVFSDSYEYQIFFVKDTYGIIRFNKKKEKVWGWNQEITPKSSILYLYVNINRFKNLSI